MVDKFEDLFELVNYTEYHDLPDTGRAKGCWVQVNGYYDGTLCCAIYGTSKATGWDFPLEYDIVRP